jgi:hypothetical protein
VQNIYTFPDFIARFPLVSLPLTLGEETHHVFGTENLPFPVGMIAQFILPVEEIAEADEFTEYLPCFALQDTEQFIAVVWWKAGLLNYEYRLATFDTKGTLIDHRVIAFTKVMEGNRVRRAVAHINEEWEIHIAEGVSEDGDMQFNPESSRSYGYELSISGEIE